MAGFFENFKQAMNEDIPGEHYEVHGNNVTCRLCGSDVFQMSRVQLNTAGMTFLDIDWADSQAYVLLCSECGHIEWFLEEPEEI